jgi:Na+/phosphate symporter
VNITILLSILCIVLGAVVYMITTHGKVAELARLMFGCGLLAFLITFTGTALRLTT